MNVAAVIFLSVSAVTLATQSEGLWRLLSGSRRSTIDPRAGRGLVRTSCSRVAAASTYVALGTYSLLDSGSARLEVVTLAVFAGVQALWITNGRLDIRIQRFTLQPKGNAMTATATPVTLTAPPAAPLHTAPAVAAGGGTLLGTVLALVAAFGGTTAGVDRTTVLVSGAATAVVSILAYLGHHLGVSKAQIVTGTTWIEGHLPAIEQAAGVAEQLPLVREAVADAKHLGNTLGVRVARLEDRAGKPVTADIDALAAAVRDRIVAGVVVPPATVATPPAGGAAVLDYNAGGQLPSAVTVTLGATSAQPPGPAATNTPPVDPTAPPAA